MEGNKERKAEIIDWETLEKKERSEQEELLMHSVYRLEPAYWVGVKRLEKYLYGAFCFHEGTDTKKRAVSAAFLLNGKEFLLAVIKDEKKMLYQEEGEQSGEMSGMEEQMEGIFDSIFKQGQKKVEKMEKYLIEMEQEIVKGRINRNRNRSIFECKRLLTVWKNDYVQFLNMVEGINGLEEKKKETQGQILNEESACYFRVYENRLNHLTKDIQFLYEELVHIREALDAALSYEENRIMKVFTTVTTVFTPLTLIAGWYGMNFDFMPELHWQYGYVFVGILSILVILVCIWFFRKKKLF